MARLIMSMRSTVRLLENPRFNEVTVLESGLLVLNAIYGPLSFIHTN